MTELTQDQRDTLARAIYRAQFTPPAPWHSDSTEPSNWHLSDANGRKLMVVESEYGILPTHWTVRETIEASATLQDLAITQARIIAEQAARIAALEEEQTTIPTPRIQVYEGNTLGIGKRWFYSVHIGHVPVSNNKSAPTEAEAYECANKAVEYYLNRLTGKSSEWGGY